MFHLIVAKKNLFPSYIEKLMLCRYHIILLGPLQNRNLKKLKEIHVSYIFFFYLLGDVVYSFVNKLTKQQQFVSIDSFLVIRLLLLSFPVPNCLPFARPLSLIHCPFILFYLVLLVFPN